jgi:hypothetical protein
MLSMKSLSRSLCRATTVLPLLLALQAQAQVDLTTLDRDMAGSRAQVLVLGTTHLNQQPKDWNAAALDPLLDRLVAYRPDIITIETEPGDECDLAARQPVRYGKDYCPSTADARAATGLDIPDAITEVNKTLKTWPVQPSAAQRRHLAALFLAAAEPASAYAQWLQLRANERHGGNGLSAALVDKLGKIAATNNESYLIAARLTARLGLQRVYQVDNHTGDNIDFPDRKAFMVPLNAAWATSSEAYKELNERIRTLERASDLLPLYRLINTPGASKLFAEANVKGPLQSTSVERYPHMWVAGWETRNLRIVANIRETFRERPGARVLSIIGASHKPWLDS